MGDGPMAGNALGNGASKKRKRDRTSNASNENVPPKVENPIKSVAAQRRKRRAAARARIQAESSVENANRSDRAPERTRQGKKASRLTKVKSKKSVTGTPTEIDSSTDGA